MKTEKLFCLENLPICGTYIKIMHLCMSIFDECTQVHIDIHVCIIHDTYICMH